jgi:hypothetical protein
MLQQNILAKSKKILLLFLLLLSTTYISHGQIKDKFSLGVDFGLVQSNQSTDVHVGGDINYRLSNHFDIGFRIGSGAFAKKFVNSQNKSISSDSRVGTTYLITTDYYLDSIQQIIPFISGGIGFFNLPEISDNVTSNNIPVTFRSKIGYMIKTGFVFDKIKIALAYHIISKSQTIIFNTEQDIDNKYLTFSLGYFIGKNVRN